MKFISDFSIVDFLVDDIRREAVRFSDIKAEDKVLDICCGTGKQALYFSKAGAIAYGIDKSSKSIDKANYRKRLSDNQNSSFQLSDAANLPFEDHFFDYACISLALHEKSYDLALKVLKEASRVIKKNGQIIIIDYTAPMPFNAEYLLILFFEILAGKEHFNFFRKYLKRGGLKPLLKETNLVSLKEKAVKNSTISILKVGFANK